MFMNDWRTAIGESGEDLIRKILRNKHNLVEETVWYDPKKDGVVDSKPYEVKTLMENYAYKAFMLGSSQWNKCENVDRLFFVRIPEAKAPIRIYECSKSYRQPSAVFMNGDNCRAFKLTNLTLYDTIYDETLGNEWRSLTKTKYMRNKP